MIIEFDKSFDKALDKIRDKSLFPRVEKIILNIEKSTSLSEVSNIKKVSGFQDYFRIRIGDYRLGFEKIGVNTVRFIIIAHRKDIYKLFP
ncbi:MAG: type II toxin-antitoxin system RelE/ParE family toxin [Porphyromonadaceae bacterium]|nr:MAG: type II toxin-antitoxin system RelE/ParE family toxin [Porphyromonadaceae bacterium]